MSDSTTPREEGHATIIYHLLVDGYYHRDVILEDTPYFDADNEAKAILLRESQCQQKPCEIRRVGTRFTLHVPKTIAATEIESKVILK